MQLLNQKGPGSIYCLHKPKLFLIIDLLLFTKLLELLATNHSLSEKSIFVPWLLKFSHVLVVL